MTSIKAEINLKRNKKTILNKKTELVLNVNKTDEHLARLRKKNK